jgi:hypothetical protein
MRFFGPQANVDIPVDFVLIGITVLVAVAGHSGISRDSGSNVDDPVLSVQTSINTEVSCGRSQWLSIVSAVLWAVSGGFWVASARASHRARAELTLLPTSMRMAPGSPGAVSTDWLVTYQRTQIPVNRHNFYAASFAAGAGFIGVVQALAGTWGG